MVDSCSDRPTLGRINILLSVIKHQISHRDRLKSFHTLLPLQNLAIFEPRTNKAFWVNQRCVRWIMSDPNPSQKFEISWILIRIVILRYSRTQILTSRWFSLSSDITWYKIIWYVTRDQVTVCYIIWHTFNLVIYVFCGFHWTVLVTP